MTDIGKNLWLFGITTLVCLFLIELGLWFLSPPMRRGIGTTETPKAKIYGWAMPAKHKLRYVNPDTGEVSSFTTNSQGWKDTEHQFQKPPGVVRILFVGDSYTWGLVGLEDLYTRQVERLLKERGFSSVEVISIGIGGWGTDQELEALQVEGIKYSPDIVICQFCGNDVENNISPNKNSDPSHQLYWKKPFKYELINGTLKKIKLEPRTDQFSVSQRIKRTLLRSAVIYNLHMTYHSINSWLERKTRKAPAPINNLDQYPLAGKFFDSLTDETRESEKKAWELLEVIILKMKQVCEEHGARFIVFSEAGDEGRRRRSIRWNDIRTDGVSDFILQDGKKYTFDFKRPLKNLKKICQKHEIPLIEPVRIYERYTHDMHTNKIGNLRVAQDIVDFLTNWEPYYQIIAP